jgi:hypothetical protein
LETHGFLYIFIISLVERRAWEALESLKTFGFLYIFIIYLVERRAWEAPESLKTYGFLYTGERGKLQNHENIKISIHLHYFFGGTEGVGSSGIIENNIDFLLHFRYFFVERRAWEAPETLKRHRFHYIFIISLVERRAWEAPESLKTHGCLYILIISLVERRAWEAPESLKTYGFL